MILLVPACHQVLLEICLVLLEFICLFLLLFPALLDHEDVVVFALHLVDRFGLVLDLSLVELDLLHHGRAYLVQIVNQRLVLPVQLLFLLVAPHGVA